MILPIQYNAILDIKGISNKIDIIKCTAGDSNSYQLNITIINSTNRLDLAGYTAKITFQKSDNTKVFQDLIIDNATNGIMHVVFDSQVIAVEGQVHAEIEIFDSTSGRLTVGSFSFSGWKRVA